jgi:hypothetical protein
MSLIVVVSVGVSAAVSVGVPPSSPPPAHPARPATPAAPRAAITFRRETYRLEVELLESSVMPPKGSTI